MHFGLSATRIGAFLATLALLAACSGHSDGAPGSSPPSLTVPTTSPAPTLEPTYPNTLPGEKPPVRPLDVLSDAGAENFARYFIQTVDWTYAAMDTAPLRTTYDPTTCTYCEQVVNRTERAVADGKHYVGGRLHFVTVSSSGAADVSHPLVLVIIDADAIQTIDASGGVLTDSPAGLLLQLNLRLRFDGGRWTMLTLKQVITP
jgi:hypothetical protein